MPAKPHKTTAPIAAKANISPLLLLFVGGDVASEPTRVTWLSINLGSAAMPPGRTLVTSSVSA